MRTIIRLFILAITTATFGQHQICGTVSENSTGAFLPSVSIVEKGTNNSTISDIDGYFCHTVSLDNSTLHFLFMGFTTGEITLTGETQINIVLIEDFAELEEIIVMGYDTANGYSNVKISNKDILKRRNNTTSTTTNYPAIPQTNRLNDESYADVKENGFISTKTAPLSTSSIDVNNASYSNIRRYLNNGQKPTKEAVRVEEMINYIKYDYPQPKEEHPLAVFSEASTCPWNDQRILMQVAMQAKELSEEELPSSNLVFLIDVSRFMAYVNKLPLFKSSLHMLTDKLRDSDRVALVVYAGAAGLVLPSTKGSQKEIQVFHSNIL